MLGRTIETIYNWVRESRPWALGFWQNATAHLQMNLFEQSGQMGLVTKLYWHKLYMCAHLYRPE